MGEIDVIVERINQLRCDVQDATDEIKAVNAEIKAVRKEVSDTVVALTLVNATMANEGVRITELRTDYNELEHRVDVIEKAILENQSIISFIKKSAWIAISALIVSGGGFLWAILTHQITILINK